MGKREKTPEEIRMEQMKYEIATELGFIDKVEKAGWGGLSSRESGKIGGIMGYRRKKEREVGKDSSTGSE